MSEQFLLPILGIFAPLIIATVAAYILLNRTDLHSGGKH